MLLKSIFTVALLALSIDAAPVLAEKTFKFQIEDPKKGKWYLADATGAGTQDVSKALDCELAGDVLKCGGKGFPDYPSFGDMLKLATTGSSSGWSIDANNTIHLSTKPNINFDVGIGSRNDLWAETCPDAHGHWTGPRGSAKAVYV